MHALRACDFHVAFGRNLAGWSMRYIIHEHGNHDCLRNAVGTPAPLNSSPGRLRSMSSSPRSPSGPTFGKVTPHISTTSLHLAIAGAGARVRAKTGTHGPTCGLTLQPRITGPAAHLSGQFANNRCPHYNLASLQTATFMTLAWRCAGASRVCARLQYPIASTPLPNLPNFKKGGMCGHAGIARARIV